RVIPLARALDVLGAYSAADKVEKSEKSEKGEKPARALERLLMPADAFYAPDYDLLVLSPERLDSVGQTFRAQNQSIYPEGVNGAADFFHRPKGPVFTTREDKLAAKDESKTFVTVALTTGYGVPNYVLHKHFKEMIARKELMTRGDPEALLRNVLSDAYYAAL